MSFTPAGAVSALAAVLRTAAPDTLVHEYRRTFRTQEEFAERTLTDGTLGDPVVQAALVSVQSMTIDEPRNFGNGATAIGQGAGVMTTVAFKVEVVRGLQDAEASEVAFRNTVFAMMQAVNTLGKLYLAASWQGPMSATQISYLGLDDFTILHYATLEMTMKGRTSP